MNRSTRSIFYFAGGAVFTATTLLVSLFTTPLLVWLLGDERYGASRALMDWFSYIALLELGIGGAMLPLIAREWATGNRERLKAVVGEGARAYRWIALAMTGGSLFLAALLPLLIPVQPGLRIELWCAGLLGLCATPLIVFSPLRQLLEAQQRGYVATICLLAQYLVMVGFWLLLAWLGWGIASVAAASLVAGVVFQLLLMALARRRSAEVLTWLLRPRGDPVARNELWSLNWSTLIVNLAGRVALLSDNIIIGLFISPAAVTPFWLTQRLVQIAQGQLQNIGNAGWAQMAELFARGEMEVLRSRLIELTRVTTAVGLCILGPILVYNERFVQMWVGASRYAGDWVTWLATGNALLWSLMSLWCWVFSATGKVARLKPLMIASCSANIIISVAFTILVRRIDSDRALLGPLFGTGVTMLLLNIPWLAILLRRDYAVPLRSLFLAVARPAAVLMPLVVAVLMIAAKFPPSGWLSLSAAVIFSAVVLGLVAWFAALADDERALWRLRVRLVFSKKSAQEGPARWAGN